MLLKSYCLVKVGQPSPIIYNSIRWMQRGRMPAKHGNNQYYKGSGTKAIGHFDGVNYIVESKKLKPYVSHTTNKSLIPKAIKTVQDYIDKARNPQV